MRLNIIAALKDIMSGSMNNPNTLPYNLTEEDMDKIRGLRSHESWGIYGTLLDRVSIIYGERLLTKEDFGGARWNQGFLQGLRHAYTLVDQVIKEQDNARSRSRTTAERSDERAERRRKSSFFASPGWSLGDSEREMGE